MNVQHILEQNGEVNMFHRGGVEGTGNLIRNI